MLIWVVLILMAVIAAAVVLRPLITARGDTASRADHEAAIYRDQLGELDRDVERGIMEAEEASAARIEIARRLIAADESSNAAHHQAKSASWNRPAAAAVAVMVPALALGLYAVLGSPQQPASPIAERAGRSIGQQSLAELVSRVERHLQANPTDAQGWEVVAPVYMRMRRFADAAEAWRRAISLDGESAARLSGLGEARVLASEGMVDAEARRAFEKAAAIDSSMAQPRYYLGLAAVQDRDFAKAVTIWEALVADAPAGASWREEVERQITVARANLTGGPIGGAGPSDEDVAAAAQMTDAERRQMIEAMVAGLAARLDAEGGDLEGWLRLVRAYVVLQKPEEARAAMARAREEFAEEADALARLEGAAEALGL